MCIGGGTMPRLVYPTKIQFIRIMDHPVDFIEKLITQGYGKLNSQSIDVLLIQIGWTVPEIW